MGGAPGKLIKQRTACEKVSGDRLTFPLASLDRVKRYIVFKLDTSGSGFEFRAGKYVTLTIDAGEGKGRTSRIFSIASSPLELGKIRFATIYREGSDFKNRLLQYSPGDLIEVSRPLGGFLPVSNSARPLIFITSGIGITPVVSIVRWSLSVEADRRMHLVYVNQTEDEELFMDELLEDLEGTELFSMTRIRSKESESELPVLLTQERLGEYCPDVDPDYAVWYVSGKPRFVYEVRKILQNSGISGASIKTETFAGY